MGIEEGEETQAKGTDDLFNRIITKNFPNLEKERVTRFRKPIEPQTDRTRNTPRHIIIKTLSTQNKERTLKAVKEKSHI
jgi:hypothetical protein